MGDPNYTASSKSSFTYDEASGLNRKARRALGKENGIKIHGRRIPIIKKKEDGTK